MRTLNEQLEGDVLCSVPRSSHTRFKNWPSTKCFLDFRLLQSQLQIIGDLRWQEQTMTSANPSQGWHLKLLYLGLSWPHCLAQQKGPSPKWHTVANFQKLHSQGSVAHAGS